MKLLLICNHRIKRTLTIWGILLCGMTAYPQNTVVVGRVTDATSGKLMPYVNIIANTHERNAVGGVSDGDGHFNIQSPIGFDTLTFGFVGYETVHIVVKPHIWQNISVEMQPSRITLQEAVVVGKRERYKRRDNPAVELMRHVIAHKDSNSIKQQSHYSYRSHEKIELDLLGVKDTLLNQKTLQHLNFLFDGLQTSPISGQRFIPGFFVENIYEHLYRRTPQCETRKLTGEKHIEITKFLEPQTIEYALHDIFGDDINIFNDKIHILDNELISPLANGATLFYRYYIDDTIVYDGDSCFLLTFVPANPRDIGFCGTLIVGNDGRYTLRRARLELPEKSNINFVRSLEIEQRYAMENGVLHIIQNNEVMEGRFYGVPMRGRKEIHYANYLLGDSATDSNCTNNGVLTRDDGYSSRDDLWWENHRIAPLSENELHTYEAAKQLNNLSFFRWSMNTMMAFATGYADMGLWDYGPVESTLSWNDVEGVRLRVGGKTNTRLNNHWFANGFVAYGTKDHEWKYNAEIMYSFREKLHHQWEFPAHLITAGIEHNNDIPGQTFFMDSYDRFFRSIGGGNTDLMVMKHRYYAEYWIETKSHLSAKLLLEHKTISPLARLTGNFSLITTASANMELRYARNETFYQSQRWRTTLNSTAPIVTLRYSYNAPLLGADYDYSRLELILEKKSYLWNFGFADITLQTGGIIGRTAYPLLFCHPSNPGIFYQKDAFNMMNYMEFVSDRYIQALFDYNFNGYIFNRIPLLRQLGWREVFSVKALWGRLSQTNTPTDSNGLPRFVLDADGCPRIYTLNEGPYIESNVGIDNIFRVLRVDYVRRLSYLDHPHASRWGIRIRLHISF